MQRRADKFESAGYVGRNENAGINLWTPLPGPSKPRRECFFQKKDHNGIGAIVVVIVIVVVAVWRKT